MRAIKLFVGGLVACLVEIAVGILLLIHPEGFTTGIVITCGIVLIASGSVCIVRYFAMDAEAAASGNRLFKGLTLLLAGCFCAFHSKFFTLLFPLLAAAYGMVILVTGLGKIQWTINMLRMKKGKWLLAAVSAVISIACGAVIIGNPFASTVVLWMFTGISLIVEAVIDMFTFLFSGNAARPNPQHPADPPEDGETGK